MGATTKGLLISSSVAFFTWFIAGLSRVGRGRGLCSLSRRYKSHAALGGAHPRALIHPPTGGKVKLKEEKEMCPNEQHLCCLGSSFVSFFTRYHSRTQSGGEGGELCTLSRFYQDMLFWEKAPP